MDYDPIKDRLAEVVTRTPALNRAFFRVMDLVFLRAWYVQRTLRRLLREIPGDEVQVLDAGTGFGQYAYWLLQHDDRVRVAAVDVKEDYLARAETFFARTGLANRITLVKHDLTQRLPEVARFDLALSIDVIEHIEDDLAVLRNMAAALRPGGYLLVNTPSDRGGSDAAAGDGSFIGEHVRDGYAPDDLAGKMEEAGLRVVEWTYTYGPPGSLAWRLLVKYPILTLNRSWLLAPLLVPYYAVAGPAGIVLNALDLRLAKPEGTGLLMVGQK